MRFINIFNSFFFISFCLKFVNFGIFLIPETHSYRKFLKLQHSIDVALIELEHGNRVDVVVSIGAMPSIRGGFYHNEVGMQMGPMIALFLIVILVITFIVPLVEEKENGLKV